MQHGTHSTTDARAAQAHLHTAAELLELELDVDWAGFGQVMQCLLNPVELFYSNTAGVNILLVRPKDIPSAELRHALEQYDADPKATATVCVLVCPQQEALPEGWSLTADWLSKVLVLHATELVAVSEEQFDAHSERIAVVPYHDRLYEAFAFLAMRAASCACLVRRALADPARSSRETGEATGLLRLELPLWVGANGTRAGTRTEFRAGTRRDAHSK